MDVVENLVPSILDMDNSKLIFPWSTEMVAEPCEKGKLGRFEE